MKSNTVTTAGNTRFTDTVTSLTTCFRACIASCWATSAADASPASADDDEDMLEMPTVRESFSEILNTAGLSKYKSKFAKHGIQSTSHLDDIVEEDLEELGLSGFQQRQFKKAVTNVKKKKKMQQNDDNNSTMTKDDIVGNNNGTNNNNNNDEESSKNVMKKKKNDEQKDKKTTPKDTEINK